MVVRIEGHGGKEELVKQIRGALPLYVVTIDKIFLAKDISNAYLRDCVRHYFYDYFDNSTKFFYPANHNKIKYEKGLILTDNIEEAEELFIGKRVQQIKSHLPQLQSQINREQEIVSEYEKFIAEYPEYFI